MYQGELSGLHVDSNTRGVEESVVLKVSSTLLSGHNFKVFADNYFTTLPLLDDLKQSHFWYAGTIRIKRLSNCPLLCEKDMVKKGRGSYYYRTDTTSNSIAVCWFDNKAVTLVSSFAGIEPINSSMIIEGFGTLFFLKTQNINNIFYL